MSERMTDEEFALADAQMTAEIFARHLRGLVEAMRGATTVRVWSADGIEDKLRASEAFLAEEDAFIAAARAELAALRRDAQKYNAERNEQKDALDAIRASEAALKAELAEAKAARDQIKEMGLVHWRENGELKSRLAEVEKALDRTQAALLVAQAAMEAHRDGIEAGHGCTVEFVKTLPIVEAALSAPKVAL